MTHINTLTEKYFPVLDHGFCAVVDSMGNDHAIARAARCSYGVGTKTVSDDRGLIRTLIRDMHTSPLEMCELVIHVGLPIFVARQWVRHRTASLNEYSGRYSVMPMIFYSPERDRLKTQSQTNKQGSTDDLISEDAHARMLDNQHDARTAIKTLYANNIESDLARELARIDLPLSTYTYWYWKIDLKNLLHFLKLRLDIHAQWEIRQYAKVIAGIVKEWLPLTWEAFSDYVLNGVHFSRQEQALLLKLIDGESNINYGASDNGMTRRETRSFLTKLQFMDGQVTDDIALDLESAKTPEYYEKMIQQNGVI